MKYLCIAMFGAIHFFICGVKVCAQSNPDRTNASKWVGSGKWKEGIKLTVYEDVNVNEFYSQYKTHPQLWKRVFAWLNTQNLDTLSVGKYAFAGDSAYASITDAPSREFDKSKWESHRKYIDLQYVIRGAEKIGVLDLNNAAVDVPYNDQKDNANYKSDVGKYYTAVPGTFYLFFPTDVHRPNIKVEGSDKVKKLVIKIKYWPTKQ